MRCEDLRYTVERVVDRTQTCGRIFSIGLVVIMTSVILVLILFPM